MTVHVRALPTARALIERDIIATGGLKPFVKHAWPQVIPRELLWNWHHDIICQALERVARRELRKLYIAVPPSTSKSLLVGVFYPAWTWTFNPARAFICGTYGASLTLKSARQHRDLVNSAWYKARFHDGSRIPYQNTHAAAWFENNAHGFRFSGTVGGDVTGRHAGDLIGDDLNKGQDVYGSLESVIGTFDRSWDYWDGVLPKRLADPADSARIYVGQRLHRDDVPGRWMRDDPEVEVICFPMRYDPNHPNLHPDDPRTVEGELLWPERWPEEEVQKMERRPSEFAAQFQQRPSPPGGYLLTDEYLSHRYEVLPSDIQRTMETGVVGQGQQWLTSWDLTFKGKATSDWTTGGCWCEFEGTDYLIDQERRKVGYRAAKHLMRDFTGRYPWVRKHLVEDAANGPAIVDDLEGEIPGLVLEPHAGGVLVRVQLTEDRWASGAVRLPARAQWMGGSDGFIAEHLSFDGLGTRHDDQVSQSSLALLHLSSKKASRWVDAMKAAKKEMG